MAECTDTPRWTVEVELVPGVPARRLRQFVDHLTRSRRFRQALRSRGLCNPQVNVAESDEGISVILSMSRTDARQASVATSTIIAWIAGLAAVILGWEHLEDVVVSGPESFRRKESFSESERREFEQQAQQFAPLGGFASVAGAASDLLDTAVKVAPWAAGGYVLYRIAEAYGWI